MIREMVIATMPELMTATHCEVCPKETNKRMPSIMARELIEIRHEWVCSLCRRPFYNPGCVLTGLTLNEIIQHMTKMREQAFANHVCFSHSEK